MHVTPVGFVVAIAVLLVFGVVVWAAGRRDGPFRPGERTAPWEAPRRTTHVRAPASGWRRSVVQIGALLGVGLMLAAWIGVLR